ITSGNNGAPCLTGYDLCSGRGSWVGGGSGGTTLRGSNTAVSSSQNPSTVGQSVTFTGTVTPASGTGTPSGTLQFKDGSTNLGSAQTLNGSGQASVSTSSFTQGPHSITAVYSGDSTFPTSTSPALTQTVMSTTVVAPSSAASLSGSEWLNASADTPPATGVDFLISGGPPGYSNQLVGHAGTWAYGWLFVWNTTTVVNGTYSLKSRAFAPGGVSVDSPSIPVTINNLSTAVTVPSNGATVSGAPAFVASASGTALQPVTSVQFLLSGGPPAYSKRVLGGGTSTVYGWFFFWNTATVVNGTYTLQSRAF